MPKKKKIEDLPVALDKPFPTRAEKDKLKKLKKNQYVTMPEIIEMKAYKLQGFTNVKIGEMVGRTDKIVAKYLGIFEKMLPESADLKTKVLDRIEEIKEQMMQNAERICLAADHQVMRKIFEEETSAIDAAKINQIYSGKLLLMSGVKDPNGMLNGGDNSPKVLNFINTVINISNNQNDRFGPNAGDESRTPENDKGRATTIIEGIVS